ncbi:hypothetical protein AU255_04870 [Methyloprofundus sedimenti]|uniref:Uncharacterized protein n=1 Tax=Methyloprofundus sedimenti TaxID=1420851 RepID=A0A1V8M6U9_9GAMM|nr:hypothetical protein [Methyloprofundus sedimenti]OQK17228.1 hypothetical protein AU255_04870 [Methyloprofundus sedimenti]
MRDGIPVLVRLPEINYIDDKANKPVRINQHTDAQRKYTYDRDSHIDKLDKALDAAQKNGWTVLDMQQDWIVIYPAN